MLYSFLTLGIFIGAVFGKDYGLSGKMEPTPIGYRPVECVFHAEEDAVLHPIEGVGTHVYYPGSGHRSFHPEIKGCVEQARDLTTERKRKIKADEEKRKNGVSGEKKPNNVSNLQEWEVYASQTVSTMGQYTSQYQLPTDNPTSGADIILYYFIGMQNNVDAIVTIIQPVIEYCDTCGPSGGTGWNMSPWNCCANGQTWQGPIKIIPANGALINGVVMANTTYDYISCENPSNGDKTVLNVLSDRRTFDWIAFTLEQYNVASCADYPTTPFWSRSMKLTYASGTTFTPTWSFTNGDGCGGNIKEQDAFDLALYSNDL